jgi:membrane associated rhomboid family serine protease
MAPDERKRVLRAGIDFVKEAVEVARRHYRQQDTFRDALVERTPRVFVTPAFGLLSVVLFVLMVPGAGPVGSPETLVAWGGNLGLQTTNGQWWRLVTNVFVHRGMFSLAVNVIGLVQIGLVLERLVGRLAFGGVYVAAGTLASLVSLSSYPVDVSVGASAAVFGLYGMFLVSLVKGWLYPLAISVPLTTLKWLAPGTAVFTLYNLVGGGLGGNQIVGLLAGAGGGFALARGVGDERPSARRVVTAVAATAVLAVAFAVPLRGVVDVRPAIDTILEFEDRTASTYQDAVKDFRRGRLTSDDLVRLINETIIPELEEFQSRVQSFERVPTEHQSLVSNASEYLQLRNMSWRLRAEGLQKISTRTLAEADREARAALDAFETLRTSAQSARP